MCELITPNQQYTMGLIVTQAVWFVVHPWCLSGEDIGQELTVPVQHLYCARVTNITHQDV